MCLWEIECVWFFIYFSICPCMRLNETSPTGIIHKGMFGKYSRLLMVSCWTFVKQCREVWLHDFHEPLPPHRSPNKSVDEWSIAIQFCEGEKSLHSKRVGTWKIWFNIACRPPWRESKNYRVIMYSFGTCLCLTQFAGAPLTRIVSIKGIVPSHERVPLSPVPIADLSHAQGCMKDVL